MQTNAQVTFHQLPASPALEADVQRRIAELDEVYAGIIHCRVLIEAPHRHRRQGRLFNVHVDVQVAGASIIADRSHSQRAEHDDPYVAVADAFRATRRQLEDHLQRQRGDVKSHNAET